MRVALAVPCYVDQLRPSAARAALTLLERLGCEVSLAFDAPCCGQPMCNAGAVADARAASTLWAKSAAPFDYVVMPSGSCTHHVRHQLLRVVDNAAGVHAAKVTYELCEFITGPLGVQRLHGSYMYRVAVHVGCHALRGLRLGGASELHQPPVGPMHQLLASLDGITMVSQSRVDECCGFGGSFAIGEADVSVRMGEDRIGDYLAGDADVLVSSDPSCLMHLEGIVAHRRTRLCTLHIAELLEQATREPAR